MFSGPFGETSPGQQLGEAIPRPGYVGQAFRGTLVGKSNAHESVFVGWLCVASAHVATERSYAERPSGVIALGQHDPADVPFAQREVACALHGLGLMIT